MCSLSDYRNNQTAGIDIAIKPTTSISAWFLVALAILLSSCTPSVDFSDHRNSTQYHSLLTSDGKRWYLDGLTIGMPQSTALAVIAANDRRQTLDDVCLDLPEEGYYCGYLDDVYGQPIGVTFHGETVTKIEMSAPSDIQSAFELFGTPDGYVVGSVLGPTARLHEIELIFADEGIVITTWVDSPNVPANVFETCKIPFRSDYPTRSIQLGEPGDTQHVVDQIHQGWRLRGQWLPWPDNAEYLEVFWYCEGRQKN